MLARATRQVVRGYQDALSGTTTWVSVADARGVVIYEWSSTVSLRDRLTAMAVSSGVVLDESTVGTNGVGLALATRAPAVVRGSEHFNSNWHSLVCAAAPIPHPITNEPLGAVNITCLAGDENQHLKITLELMVAGIRSVLTAGLRSHRRRPLPHHEGGWSSVFGAEPNAPGGGRRMRTDVGPLGPIEQAEYDVIRSVLRDVEGNKSEAAERLRISRGTLYERLRRYGITDS
jgi:transcriptional regulator of acetoin/glycerol metabolism